MSSQEIQKNHDGNPLKSEEILTYIKSPQNRSVWHFSTKLDVPNNVVHKKRVAWILCFKIRPSQEIPKIRDGTALELEEILTYIKSPQNGTWPSQEIPKIRDGTPLELEEILTYIKSPQNGTKKRVAWILFFKIMPSQEILKIRDGTLFGGGRNFDIHKKSSRNGSVCHFLNKLDDPSNIVQKKRVWPSQEILKIRDGTPLESEEILAYIKAPKMDRYGTFIASQMPSQEILKIRDGTPSESEEILTYIKKPPKQIEIQKNHDGNSLKSEEILTYIKSPQNRSKKRVAWILFFKIMPSQEILKIRDGTLFGGGRNFDIHKKSSRNGSVCHFSNKLDDPSNIVQNKRVARILFFKIRPSQEILKIHDGNPLESEEILTYIKKPPKQIEILKIRDGTPLESEEILKKRVAWILFFKIRPSQEILKIRDGTPSESEEILTYIKKPPKQIEIQKNHDGNSLKSEEILTYIKSPQNRSVWHFSTKLDVPNNVVHKKRVAWILCFKIRPSQEIPKIRDGTPLNNVVQNKRVAWILFFKIRPSQKILKIRDGTPLESEEILTYIKSPQNGSVWHFFSKLDVPSNVVQNKRVAWILFFKIRPSQEILKIRDGTPLEVEEILTYIKKALETDRSSQEIQKNHDGNPLKSKEILTDIKSPQNRSVWHFSTKLDVPNNVVHKKRVAWMMCFKIRPSQEIPKIRDGTPLELEEILTYIKSPQNGTVWHFSSKLYIHSNVVQNKRVAWILFFKIRPSQKILKIRDGTPLESEEILTYIKSPQNGSKILKIHDGNPLESSQEIQKNHDGNPLKSKEILTDIKSPQNRSVWHFSTKLDVPNNVVHKKRVAWIMCFKIRPSQEIPKIRDGTPLELEEILTYIKSPQNGTVCHFSSKLYIHSNVVQNKRVAWILFFKIRPSQKILKIRDGTPLESEEILTYIKSPQNGSVWHFSSNLDVPSNVVQNKRVAWILFFKIRPSQEILKIRDGTPLEVEEILTYIKKALETDRSFQEILKIHDGNPLESGEILTNIKSLQNGSWSSQEIQKNHDGNPLKSKEILTDIKSPQNRSVWHFSTKLDVPNNVVHKKRVAWIMCFKIRPSQEIPKIRDGTPLELEEILTYIKSPQNGTIWHFSSKLYIHSNVVQNKRVAWILFFKIRSSQKILKIRDGTPLESEEILTYIKSPQNGSVWHFSSKLDVPTNVVQNKRVAWILFFKIRPSQEILKIRDGTPLEVEEILTYIKKALETDRSFQEILKIHDGNPLESGEILTNIKKPPKRIESSQEIQKNHDGNPLKSKEILTDIKSPQNRSVWPSQEIPKIRDGTPLELEEILTYIKSPQNGTVWTSQKILKIRDGTPLESEEIVTYIKSPQNGSVWHFSSKLDVPSNVLQKKRVAWILFFKIMPSQEILKIRDGSSLEAEEILTYIKKLPKRIGMPLS
ncbi:hypothetical protein OROMI_015119 [Orobanche minor]